MKQTMATLMNGHTQAEILCGNRKTVVRWLKVVGETIYIDAISETIDGPLSTELKYEAWVMDRGSLLFHSPERGMLKLCTEWDIIRFRDGAEKRIEAEGEA